MKTRDTIMKPRIANTNGLQKGNIEKETRSMTEA